MREIIYFSSKARTSGNFRTDDLMKAGRMDIVCNVIIHAFFISNNIREDVRLHLIFNGPPNPPMHLILEYDKDMPISKKDVAGLIKRMLYKVDKSKGKLVRVFPGCSIEKKSFEALIKEKIEEGKEILLLDRRGKDIREIESGDLKKVVFVLGDHEGLTKNERRFLKGRVEKISIGKPTYFTSQTLAILHNELDRREENS